MENTPTPRSPRASRISIAQMMQPEQANPLGNVHGGWIMKLVDEAGALAAMRHARKRMVTVAVDSMVFREPIKIGHLVTLSAEVTYVGRTSIEAEVQVMSENPITGESTHTNTAYVVYVALDDEGHPTTIPPLVIETEEEQQRLDQAKRRQQYRISQK